MKMAHMKRLALSILCLLPGVARAGDMMLWYQQPAAKWEEALPIGSGRVGVMVFGGTAEERIQFNEDTLWTGKPHDYVRDGAGDHLAKIRQLVFEGKQEDAAKLFREKMISDPPRQKAFQPFGDLRFTFPGHEKATDYRRELDLSSAIARTMYRVGDVVFMREVFASYPDNAIMINVTSSQPGKLNFTMKLSSPHEISSCAVVGESLAL